MAARTEGDFSGLAEIYRRSRPSYPADLMAAVATAVGDVACRPDALAVDVGAGTGIFTRQLRATLPSSCAVLGVEPNADMRNAAEADATGTPGLRYAEGMAERLPVPDNAAVLLAAGQAAHWFDRAAFFDEAARVLATGGVLAMFQNNRDWRTSPFMEAYERFIEAHAIRGDGSRYTRAYRDGPFAQELLRRFGHVVAQQFRWVRRMEVDAFVEMAASSTQVQRAFTQVGDAEGRSMIRDIARTHANAEGEVSVPYISELYMARPGGPMIRTDLVP